MRKLFILPLLAIIAIYSPIAYARYPDVEDSRWSYPYITDLTDKGIIEGNPDGTFTPTRTMTNAEFVTILIRATLGEPPSLANPKHWAEKYINAAVDKYIVISNELPMGIWDEPISRQNMARMIMRTLKEVYNEPEVTNTFDLTINVKDWHEVHDECKPYVVQAYAKGIILKVDGGFLPLKSATREEAVTIIVRMLNKAYRYSLVGGIPFCAKTDVTEDGLMKLNSAKPFIMKTLDSLKFYKEGDKYFFTVTFPEVPNGFEMGFSVNMNPGIGYETDWIVADRAMPNTGTVTKELPAKFMAQIFQKGSILTGIWVATISDVPSQIRKDGAVKLLSVYNDGKLESFSSSLTVTNGAASMKSASDMQLNYANYFTY